MLKWSRNSARRRSMRMRLRVAAGFLIIAAECWILLERHHNHLDYLIVTSESMEPTLMNGDRVLMKRAGQYHVGDIVVFEQPGKPKHLIVKRILAMPGDLVEMKGDEVKVTHPATPAVLAANPEARLIKPLEVFVAGDNRAVSLDSRDYGPIPLKCIHGTVRYKFVKPLRWVPVH